MNEEDIIRMADKAGLEVCRGDGWPNTRLIPKLMRFAALVATAEREAIIQAIPGGHYVDPQWVCDMIRARSKE